MKNIQYIVFVVLFMTVLVNPTHAQDQEFDFNTSTIHLGVGVHFYDETPYFAMPIGVSINRQWFLYSFKGSFLITGGELDNKYVRDSSISSGCRVRSTGRFAESSDCIAVDYGVAFSASAGFMFVNEDDKLVSLGPVMGANSNAGYFHGIELKGLHLINSVPVATSFTAGYSPATESLVAGISVALGRLL